MEKITKKMEGGECVYLDEKGEKIGTYKEDIDWAVRVNLEPLRDFLNMTFDDDEGQKMAFIAGALLERAEEKIYEATHYLHTNYGTVELERAVHGRDVKPDTILGIVFTPCKEVQS